MTAYSEPPDGREALRAALEQLRLKLLDLTGRNRLLNFKHTAGRSLQSVEGCPQAIYQRLVEGNGKTSIVIRAVPEPHRSEWPLRDGRYVRPEAAEWAAIQKIPTSFELPPGGGGDATLRALLYPDDLAKHGRKLEREANLAIEETGANMLFLVLGFLEYPDQPQSDRKFLAPLISIPVGLSSKPHDGQRTFEIDYTGDELAANLSLYEKLRVDHGLTLPEFDEEDLDVERHFAEIAAVVRSRPGFELKRRVSLCLLSFTNMLLVRDLDSENWPASGEQHALLDHPVVRSLFEGQHAEDGDGALLDPPIHEVDEGPAAKIPLVFDADSSQHSALVDVLQENRNLVIEGPPGTGKSQTITNLIAACIAAGKTVLFVAEKLAALEVVKTRLSIAGLDPFVLELHSSKTSKKRVLEELGKRIAFRPTVTPDVPRQLEVLTSYRQQLKAYVNLLTSTASNAMGLTLHALMWRAERYRLQLHSDDAIRSPPEVTDAAELTDPALRRRLDALQYLASQYEAIGGFGADSPFWGFYPNQLLPGDEHTLSQAFADASEWAASLVADAAAHCALQGGNPVGVSLEAGPSQLSTLRTLLDAAPPGGPMHLVPGLFSADSTGTRVKQLVDRLGARLLRYRELEPSVRAGLKSESAGTEERLQALQHLEHLFSSLGGVPGTASELTITGGKLYGAAQRVKGALDKIQYFCGESKLPFRGARLELARLEAFAAEAGKIPEAHWKLFNPALAEDDATIALETLDVKQRAWLELHQSLDQRLYLDALPDDESLRAAILTLREGPAWYRVFQSRWRTASSTHRTLLRTKKRTQPVTRLADLEDVARYVHARTQWRTDPSWLRCGGNAPTTEVVDLDGFLAISRWHDAMRSALDELGVDASWLEGLRTDQVKKFRRDYLDFAAILHSARSGLRVIDAILPGLQATSDGALIAAAQQHAEEICRAIGAMMGWLEAECVATATLAECLAACDSAVKRRAIASELETATTVKHLFGDQFRGLSTDVAGVMKVIDWGQQVQTSGLSEAARKLILGHGGLQTGAALHDTFAQVLDGLGKASSLERELQRYGTCDFSVWCGQDSSNDVLTFAQRLQGRLSIAATQSQALVDWSQYVVRRGEALEEGLGAFVAMLEARRASPGELPAAYGYATFGAIVKQVFRQVPEAARFSGLKQNQIRSDFRQLDKEIIAGRGAAIAADRARRTSAPGGHGGARVDDKTEMALLNHLLPQQRPRVPVRRMLARAGAAVQALKPCVMMGPQAVAQFLKPGVMTFDVVVMDEASQLRPEEAIGAIARGRQLVVVGDPKQLPPTTFFARQNQLGDEVEEYSTTEAESILDICIASFRPSRSLRWHYRSQHHSLIAFSNQQFYKGRLIVCPSPYGQSGKLGVRATYLAHAIYDNQTNLVEAQRVVDAVVEHITTRPTASLGVVTLNIKQRDLISELLEERLSSSPEAEEYRRKWHEVQQGLFVKNLENVQGDERDCIVISTTFGRPPGANVVRQNFGPISRQGGWRRLNVLFTRARQSVAIYTSLRPEDIVVDPSTPEGTKALRRYLEYARSGVLEANEETGHEPDSDFEVAVIEVLRGIGYEVTPQLGVSGFRLDIAVKHPDHSGTYLAAIECDGAQYHSSQSARDRDRIRQEILESLGWRGRIWRIWSTDWFRSPHQEIAKLRSFLDDLRRTWAPEYAAGQSWVEEGSRATIELDPPIEEQTLRQMVDSRIFTSDGDMEVRVGDTVEYNDAATPEETKSVRITQRVTAIEQGLIAERAPLAQALLGGVAGDDVPLNIPGMPKRLLRIVAVKRDMT